MRMLVLIWLCCCGCAFAQKKPVLKLEVNTPSEPGAVRFDASGHGEVTDPEPPAPIKLDTYEAKPLPYQGIRRDLPWYASPEIPLGPGRAWPTTWPGYGSPYGPAWPGPRLPGGWGGGWGGGFGGWGGFGPVW